MRGSGASALVKAVAESKHAPQKAQPAAQEDWQEDSSGEVNPEGGESGKAQEMGPPGREAGPGSETQSAEVSTALAQVASVLLEGQRALIEASRRTTRGKVETLAKQDGLLPSVKVTKAWLRNVGEQLKDVDA